MALPKIPESHQFAPGESAERNTDTARGPVVEDSAKEELALRPFEGVEEQHDECQRIVFVLVYADEKRYARLDPRTKTSRTAGRDQACSFVRRACMSSASPTATVTSSSSERACERSCWRSSCTRALHHGAAEGGRVGGVPAEHAAKLTSVVSWRTSRFESGEARCAGRATMCVPLVGFVCPKARQSRDWTSAYRHRRRLPSGVKDDIYVC